jgi:hypothetical protein
VLNSRWARGGGRQIIFNEKKSLPALRSCGEILFRENNSSGDHIRNGYAHASSIADKLHFPSK